MERYIGTKTLSAKPMARGEYNDYRGWTIPEGEDPSDPGYLVEYQDGGKANDSRHAGYISWSPADVFEKTYKPVLAPHLPPHQQRVVQEKSELDEKLAKLLAFSGTDVFLNLPKDEIERLMIQSVAMRMYSTILGERINNI